MAATSERTTTTGHDPAESKDYARTSPGTLAGLYLPRFWQPVHVTDQLPAGRAKPIRIMSEDFTLYRTIPELIELTPDHHG